MAFSSKEVKVGHKGCINCIDGSTSERKLIASGSDDKSIRIWDTRADRAVKCITRCFDYSVEAVRFSLDDENTLHAASGKALFSFDLRTEGIIIKSPEMIIDNAAIDDINVIAMEATGKYLAVGDDAGVVTVIDLIKPNPRVSKRLERHSSLVNAIAFSPIDSQGLVSGGFDHQLCSWNLAASGDATCTAVDISQLGSDKPDEFSAKSVNPPFVQCLSYVNHGTAIAVALGDGSIKIVSSDDPKSIWAAAPDAHAGMATALYSTGNNFLYSGGVDRTIRCWRLDDRTAADSTSISDIEQTDAVDNLGEVLDEMKIEAPVVSKNKKKKDKKRNKRFASNNYKLQFSLIWDEDHMSKINVLSSFYTVDRNLPLEKIFVGDVTDNLTMYTL